MTSSLPTGVSVIVPVYKSPGTLEPLVDRLFQSLNALQIPFEVILVDDGSGDGSWETIARLSQDREWLVPVRLTRNFGQHNAILCGLRKARYALSVTMDDDLQHPPEEIGHLIDSLGSNDVLYGTPRTPRQGFVRGWASKLIRLILSKTMGTSAARHISAFRVFRTHLREGFSDYASPFVSIDVLLSWVTSRFSHVIVEHEPRQAGRSNYTLGRLIAHTTNLVTGFSVLPLQVASVTGLIGIVLGGALTLFLVVRRLTIGSPVPGFTFIASVVILFAGVQLFALGLIGEYLARVHVRTMGRPTYVEAEDTSGDG